MNKILMITFVSCCLSLNTNAQKPIQYNLIELLNNNQLIIDTSNHTRVLIDRTFTNAISTQKVV